MLFEHGDVLVLFSDGYFETLNPKGIAFGLERLEEVIRENRHESAKVILQRMDDEIVRWQGNQPQQDDITGIIITPSTPSPHPQS